MVTVSAVIMSFAGKSSLVVRSIDKEEKANEGRTRIRLRARMKTRTRGIRGGGEGVNGCFGCGGDEGHKTGVGQSRACRRMRRRRSISGSDESQ